MSHTALILGDQLSHANPALQGAERVVLVESRALMARRRYHRQRRHLVLSAMRHFARELVQEGREVVYKRADDYADGLEGERDVVCAEPNTWTARTALEPLGVSFRESRQFLTRPEDFRRWADSRKRVRMEDSYREQRVRLGLLMDGDEPAGGRWNFDRANRKPARGDLTAPPAWTATEDEIDEEVRRDLDAMDLPTYGHDGPRRFPATAAEARAALDDFLEHRLKWFGPWQDTMVPGRSTLFHSRLSAAYNLWLLDPLEAARGAEERYRRGEAPIESVEGFVRQVIGWREYVWGMYWWRREEWTTDNALGAHGPLPEAFHTGETEANCLRTVVRELQEEGWVNHIQRLMVLGQLNMLLGTDPQEVIRWFHASFIDGAEWVMAPNAAAMALHADGGVMFTKPYAAGGNYIDRMSGYCKGCRFNPRQRTGDDACPFTTLYWSFLDEHEERWRENRRMRGPLRTLANFDAGERDAIRERAEVARAELGVAPPT